MALYAYKKEVVNKKKKTAHTISYLSLVLGAVLLFWTFYPIVSFEIYSRFFLKNIIMSPVPTSEVASSIESAGSVLASSDVFSSNLRDFVQAKLWFPAKEVNAQTPKIDVGEYSLSIPKLNITDAKVEVGGEDLSQALIHYVPESLPGEFGNVSIFGHSTLPQLYDVTNYKSIFTYLPSMERGDTIVARVGDLEYEYEVYDMFVVKPDNISVLDQQYDSSYITLVTCVPPGTYWLRLVVKAKLKNLPEVH